MTQGRQNARKTSTKDKLEFKFFSNHVFTYYNKETERGDFKDAISAVILYTFPYTKLDLAPSSSPRGESQWNL